MLLIYLLTFSFVLLPIMAAVKWKSFLSNFVELYKFLQKYPGPPETIFGNITTLLPVEETFYKLAECRTKYGPIFKLWVGFVLPVQLLLFVSDVSLVEKILSSSHELNKTFNYKYLKKWLGEGLITSTGEKYKKRRKVIVPTFHQEILRKYVDTFNSNANILAGVFGRESGKKSMDISNQVKLCALDNIFETAMGTKIYAQESPNSDYVKSIEFLTDNPIRRTGSPLKMFDFFYYFTKDYSEEEKAVRISHEHAESTITSRKKELKKMGGIAEKKRLALIDHLLLCKIDGKPLEIEEIREEVETFLFAGHDAVTSATCFSLFSLAQYQEVQEKVVEEIRSIVGNDKDKPVTWEDLKQMKYLEMTIKESLRMFATVPIFGRCLKNDLVHDNTTIPKGTCIIICPHGINHDPNIYHEPDKFNPERFTAENEFNRSPYANITFSAGTRSCPGQKYAMLQIKTTVSTILRKFRLLPAEPEHKLFLVTKISLQSRNGIRIRIVERTD